MTALMKKSLTQRGFQVRSIAYALRDIKEKTCRVALDYTATLDAFKDSDQVQYELPDGEMIQIDREQIQYAYKATLASHNISYHNRCPEVFFQPSLIEKDGPGLHQDIIALYTKLAFWGDTPLQPFLNESSFLKGLPGELLSRVQRSVRISTISNERLTRILDATNPTLHEEHVRSGALRRTYIVPWTKGEA